MSDPGKPNLGRSEARGKRQEAALEAQRRKRRNMILIVAACAALVVAIALVLVNLLDNSEQSTELGDVPEIDWASVPQDGMTLGDPNAPVTIIEYADFQCPFCGNFAKDTLPRIVEDYVLTGKVKVEFRVVPFLSRQPMDSDSNESVQAAEAAACALDQGQYWQYNHTLFAHQNGENEGAFVNANLIALAEQLGLDKNDFTSCLTQGTHQQAVINSLAQAQSEGIAQTPTLVINGETVYMTAEGYPRLKSQIDAAIDEAAGK